MGGKSNAARSHSVSAVGSEAGTLKIDIESGVEGELKRLNLYPIRHNSTTIFDSFSE
jgi:hypothetical protein